MKILGIDPGLATIGFAVLHDDILVDFGTIRTPAGLALPERLLQISHDVEELMREFCPDVVAIEELFFVQNVTSGMMVSHARGVLLCAFAAAGVPVLEVSPKDVKLAVCGYGNAPKAQIQHMLQRIFSLSEIPQPDDAADAIAIAFWAAQQKSAKTLEITPVPDR